MNVGGPMRQGAGENNGLLITVLTTADGPVNRAFALMLPWRKAAAAGDLIEIRVDFRLAAPL